MATLGDTSTITYSVSSCSDSLLEASKEFVIKLAVEEGGTFHTADILVKLFYSLLLMFRCV